MFFPASPFLRVIHTWEKIHNLLHETENFKHSVIHLLREKATINISESVCVLYIDTYCLSTLFHYNKFLLGGMSAAIIFKTILNHYASITLKIILKLYTHYFLLKNISN